VSWLDLTRAETEPLVFSERPVLPPGSGGEDVVSASPVELAGRVERAGRGYRLEGRAAGIATLHCSRCLSEFEFPFSDSLDLLLLPAAAAPREDETRLERDDLEVRFFEAPQLDLAEVAAEQFALALPMKPLCTAECRGLCARCGANLNQGPCSCPAESDDRWAPLLSWRPGEES
jgi:uncharacterized protein